MPGDFTYFRKYIILRNDYTNIDDIHPKGHGKIEIKGNRGTISINLENCEVEEEYRIYLLKDEGGLVEELDLGRILTDERGKARININVSPRELESKGFSVEKIEGVIIRRNENILLGAYVDKNTGAIDRYINSMARPKEIGEVEENVGGEEVLEEETEYVEGYEEDIVEEIQDVEETLEPEVETEEEIDFEHEAELEETTEPEEEDLSKYFPVSVDYEEAKEEDKDFEAVVEPKGEEIGEVEENDYEEVENRKEEVVNEMELEAEAHEESIESIPQEYIQEPYSYQYQSLEYMRRVNNKNQMTNYILSILKFFPQVQPFKIYLHGYTWWRIDDDGSDSHRGFLPYYNYLFSADYKYPFLYNSTSCMNQIMKYGHYLFGLYKEGNETKYYVYAVPGNFTSNEHPFKGITGFNTWYESIDGVGYWILYIDPMTGKTIYPINPMIPTE